MSSLDKQENISSNFNNSADVELEKRAAQYQLKSEERQEMFDLRNELTNKTREEISNFKNPEEFNKRLKQKHEDLSKNNNPALENTYQGERRSIPNHQLLQVADKEVRNDHQAKLNSYNREYQKGVSNVLDRAAEDGRGPQEQETNRDQNRGQDQDQSRDR